MENIGGGTKQLTLLLSDDDLDAGVRGHVMALKSGTRVLADNEDPMRALFDALPTIIAKRLRAITPPGFAITELEICLSVEGKLCGTGIGGDVTVKLAPQQHPSS